MRTLTLAVAKVFAEGSSVVRTADGLHRLGAVISVERAKKAGSFA
jgi:hypothetical protein